MPKKFINPKQTTISFTLDQLEEMGIPSELIIFVEPPEHRGRRKEDNSERHALWLKLRLEFEAQVMSGNEACRRVEKYLKKNNSRLCGGWKSIRRETDKLLKHTNGSS